MNRQQWTNRRNPLASLALILALALGLATAAPTAHSAIVLDVSLDTSPLIDSPAGPFALAFTLLDGDGDFGNTTVTIGDFQFGGGSALGEPFLEGGASGDLDSEITMTDTTFFNDFVQGFIPGAFLAFRMTLERFDGTLTPPDALSFAILRDFSTTTGEGVPIPTLDPTGADSFLIVELTHPLPTILTFAGDPETGLGLGAPTVAVVPEPSTLMLSALGLGILALWSGRGRTVG